MVESRKPKAEWKMENGKWKMEDGRWKTLRAAGRCKVFQVQFGKDALRLVCDIAAFLILRCGAFPFSLPTRIGGPCDLGPFVVRVAGILRGRLFQRLFGARL